jgi:hypothetical protein
MSSRANKIQDQDFDQILVSFETVIDLFDINDIDASPIISGQTEM